MDGTVAAVWQQGKERLAKAGVNRPDLDAEILLREALGISRASFFARLRETVDTVTIEAYRDMIDQRAQGMPVQYILGRQEFMGLGFTLSPDVLIPRPETEILVELVLTRLGKPPSVPSPKSQVPSPAHVLLADLGTGSGAIAVSLAAYLPDARVSAVDISEQALRIAQSNAAKHKVIDRVTFLHGDFMQPLLEAQLHGQLHAIISNPPYIPTGVIPTLERHVQSEPQLALDGGLDGLTFYRRLAAEAQSLLRPDGFVAVEVGDEQADEVAALFKGHGYANIEVHTDLAGIARVVVAYRPKSDM